MTRRWLVILMTFFPLNLSGDQLPPPEPTREPLPVVAFYGDSFTSGYGGMGVGEANWTTRVARALNANPANMAVGGSGYVQCPGRSTFVHEAVMHPVPGAAVNVFFGGFNDRVQTASNAVGVAAATAYAAAQAANPGAALVVVGPQWPNSAPPELIYRHRDEIRAAALGAGARWVDPLEQRWFFDRPDLIWAGDGIHPTDTGHAYLADLIAPHVAAALGR